MLSDSVYCNSLGESFSPEEFEIVEFYRIEGNTDPGDELIVYAFLSFYRSIEGFAKLSDRIVIQIHFYKVIMNVIENLKSYFNKKENNEITGPAPEGVCPSCWGTQEWDGEYYKFIKGQKENPSEETYDNFIKDVVRKLGKVTIRKNSYYCKTCHINFEKSN